MAALYEQRSHVSICESGTVAVLSFVIVTVATVG